MDYRHWAPQSQSVIRCGWGYRAEEAQQVPRREIVESSARLITSGEEDLYG
jgi:hypothetical protein